MMRIHFDREYNLEVAGNDVSEAAADGRKTNDSAQVQVEVVRKLDNGRLLKVLQASPPSKKFHGERETG